MPVYDQSHPCPECTMPMEVMVNGYGCDSCKVWFTSDNMLDETIPCVRCNRIMDSLEDRYSCGGCGWFLAYAKDDEPFINFSEMLSQESCPECFAFMIHIGDVYKCLECGHTLEKKGN